MNAYDAQCAYEAELERLRREYKMNSQPARIAAQAESVIDFYFSSKTMRARAKAYFYESLR